MIELVYYSYGTPLSSSSRTWFMSSKRNAQNSYSTNQFRGSAGWQLDGAMFLLAWIKGTGGMFCFHNGLCLEVVNAMIGLVWVKVLPAFIEAPLPNPDITNPGRLIEFSNEPSINVKVTESTCGRVFSGVPWCTGHAWGTPLKMSSLWPPSTDWWENRQSWACTPIQNPLSCKPCIVGWLLSLAVNPQINAYSPYRL